MQSAWAPSHKFEFSFLNGNLMVPAASLLMFVGGRDASGCRNCAF
jgi:hypothetical protein